MNRKTKIIVFASIAVLILGMAFFPRIKHLLTPGEQANATVRMNQGGGGSRALMVTAAVL